MFSYRLGRKPTVIGSMLIGGLACGLVAAVPNDTNVQGEGQTLFMALHFIFDGKLIVLVYIMLQSRGNSTKYALSPGRHA